MLQVGPTYGRRMMTGYLRSKNVHAAEGRVGKSLIKLHPDYAGRRANDTARMRLYHCNHKCE